MQAFNYHRPADAQTAVALRKGAPDGSYLAGGMTLLPTLKQRLASPSDLIDLAGLPGLDSIAVEGGRLVIGAMARHADVAASAVVRGAIPALADLAGLIGDGQVRNRGTLGGSVANSDPSADYPSAVVALGASVRTDRREIAGESFFRDLFETALEPGELITSIAFPIPTRAAYAKFPNPASRYAVAGVFVADFGGRIQVGVTGAGPCAFRATALETSLSARLDPAALETVAIDHSRFNSDMHASAEYRAALVRAMAQRAVEAMLAG